MPIGTGIIYNVGDLILSQVSGSSTSFLETKIAAATSSIVYFDSTARINSASLNSITVGTASYVSGSTSIITNLTASNISASGTSSFGYVGIGTSSPFTKLHVRLDNAGETTLALFENRLTDFASAAAGQIVVGARGYNHTVLRQNPDLGTTPSIGSSLDTVLANTCALGSGFGKLILATQSTASLIIDYSGNVGIGTSSPAYKLDVNGQGLFRDTLNFGPSVGTISWGTMGGGTGFGIRGESGRGFSLGANGSWDYLVINTSGNVGIGTTSPTAKLHIYNGSSHFEATSNGNAAIVAGLYALQIAPLSNRDSTAGSYYGGIAFNHLLNHNGVSTYNGAPQAWIGTRLQDTTGSERDYLVFATKPGTGVSGTGNDIPIERMCIDRDGLVGIGTTVPTARLHVSGSTGGVFEVDTAGGVTSFYVSASGLVGIGTSNPAFLLDVSGSSRHGYRAADTHQFTGSVSVSGSLNATASWANNVVSASYALSSSFATRAQTANALNALNTYSIAGLTSAYVDVDGSSAPTTGIYRPSTKTLGLSADSTLIFKISNVSSPTSSIETGNFIVQSGNFGLGTNSPNNKLDIFGGTGTTLNMSNVDDGNRGGKLTFISSSATGRQFYVGTNSSIYNLVFGIDSIEKARIDTNGNLGIGITSPTVRLHVSGSSIITNPNPNANSAVLLVQDDGTATTVKDGTTLRVVNNGSAANFSVFEASSAVSDFVILNNGNVGIGTISPAAKLEITGSSNSVLLNIKSPISGAILYVSGSGAVGIGTSNVGAYTLQVNGSFAATTKSFVIEHPTKAGKKLIYGSLESPYHGIRLTGRDTLVNGKCKIQLPDYIYKLILHDSVNIQLTGIKCNKTLYVDEINIPENYFTIAYDKAIFESYKDYDFFWDFTGIRADVPELITEL